MKNVLKIWMFLLMPVLGSAQQHYTDSLKNVLKNAKFDSTRYSSLNGIGEFYVEINGDSAIYYFDKAFVIAKKNHRDLNEAVTLARKGYAFGHKGKYAEALACFQESLDLASDPHIENNIWNLNMPWIRLSTPAKSRLAILAGIHLLYGILMRMTGDTTQDMIQLRLSRDYATKAGDINFVGVANMNLGAGYYKTNHIDSALILEKDAERISKLTGYRKYLPFIQEMLGNIYLKKGDNSLALQYYHKGLTTSIEQKTVSSTDNAYSSLTAYYLAKHQKDSSLYYAIKRLEIVRYMHANELGPAYESVYQSYQLANQTDSAYKYQGLALGVRDSAYKSTVKNLADFQKLSMQQQLNLQKLQKETEDAETRIRMYALLLVIVVILLIAFFIHRNSLQRKKANHLLSEQKEEIAAQRDNLSHALDELKTTQTQLVQREKMASLGELTAGIAHEIQNPLNFVNNFSEVNTEMLEELKAESEKPKAERDEQLEAELIDGLIENEKKINHHGKRADFIVKGMLQHSRTSTGEKQLTNINILADEFLKLSYHGLRAKDKSFNAEMVTNFDETLPKVNIARQDIGRVLLNLFNNAFYAVNQKAKTAGHDYKPTVEITTLAPPSGGWGAKVKDNGNGIPDSIKDKIMQPFFTTKPTGEGTGLGLSLSYDIVVKGHGGTIQVNSIEGEGSEFIITLPIS